MSPTRKNKNVQNKTKKKMYLQKNIINQEMDF